MKLTKTEQKIVERNLNRYRPAGYPISFVATMVYKSNRPGSFGGRPWRSTGVRDYKACEKLVARGLATCVSKGDSEIKIHLDPEALGKIGYECK